MRNRLHTWLPVVLSLVAFSAPAQDGTKLINAPTMLARRHLRPSFRDSLAEASRRLESPGCRLVLSDFRDADGRTLADNLEATGLSAAEYLDRRIYFTGGRGLERCQASRILAATSPGSHVVFVCDAFFTVDRADSPYVAYTLIHEMLHSLGLGENPPSPAAITTRVADRCR